MNPTYWRVSAHEGSLPAITRVDATRAFSDEYEMSGKGVDCFVRYGTDSDGLLALSYHVVFPRLRTIPNNTHASFQCDIPRSAIPTVTVGGVCEPETAVSFTLCGYVETVSQSERLRIARRLFPCDEEQALIELITLENIADHVLAVETHAAETPLAARGRGTKGIYLVESEVTLPLCAALQPGEQVTVAFAYQARRAIDPKRSLYPITELSKREEKIRRLCNEQMVLHTGDEVLDTFFALSKLRAGESIFRLSDGTLLHSPGGRAYYAASWCNDQVEYAGPHFALTGDRDAIEASMTAYRQYMPFMDAFYTKLPCSVIAEGTDIWEGAGDRGDAAMYLYGASLFALYCGDEAIARELAPAIKWCFTYCKRNLLPEGVVGSYSDELEGRFPTDRKANLSTSMLALGGARAASGLFRSLGEEATAADCERFAKELEAASEAYFGATLHGFETYRYSKGFDTLRGWISLPLCMGLKRKEGTAAALRSEYLWTEKGLLSCELGEENTSETVWDRAALYGFKGLFLAGYGEEMLAEFRAYCESRLLGERVPYPVEAWPEGDMRHLSGESALLCRVITEGIPGICPTGLHSFTVTPHIPEALPEFSLRALSIGGKKLDLIAERTETGLVLRVYDQETLLCSCKNGQTGVVRV